jgi:SAM-dependent methyltransferase
MEKINKFELYQNTVQNAKKETEFFKKVYRTAFNKVPLRFREDFCMTGLLACEWTNSNVMNEAVGIDFDQEALDYGVANNITNDRVRLVNQNVLEPYDPTCKFDIICSLNYSHFLLTKRKELLKYFTNVRQNINKGILVLDLYGGSHIYSDHVYTTIENYEFRGKAINSLSNLSECSLNYKVKKNKFKPLFNYLFRVYSIIELKECLEEAGFESFKLYIKEINEDDEDDYKQYAEIDINGSYYPESDRYTGYLICIVN